MTQPIKLTLIAHERSWMVLQMLYRYHGVLIVERFIVGMN